METRKGFIFVSIHSIAEEDEEEDYVPVPTPEKGPLWDVFRRQDIFENSSIFDGLAGRLLIAAKIAAYIVFFLIVFGGTILTKASLQVMVTQLYNEYKYERFTNQVGVKNVAKDYPLNFKGGGHVGIWFIFQRNKF